jgi:hypothetical protein
MIDQRLEHLVQPRFQKKYPAILRDLPPLGRLFAEREQRRLKTLGGLASCPENESSAVTRKLASATVLEAFQISFSSSLTPM